jgi:hypothetical protein
MRIVGIAFLAGAVTALGCGGSSSKSDGGDASGAAGNAAGGSTGAAGAGSGGRGGSAGAAGGSAGAGAGGNAGQGGAGGNAGNGGNGGSAGNGGRGGAGGSAGNGGRGGAGGVAGSAGTGGSGGGAGRGGSTGSGGSAGTGGGSAGRGGTGGGGGTAGAGGSSGSAGTGGSSGACLQVQPCGGNIVGSWQLTSECVDVESLQPTAQTACVDASITAAIVSVSGNLTFNADMSYTESATTTAIFVWHFPASCLNGATCDAFGSAAQQGLPAGVTFTCTGPADCDCTEGTIGTGSDSGTYSTSGSVLSITSDTTGPATGAYCVQGSTLHLITLDNTTIIRDTIGQKQ